MNLEVRRFSPQLRRDFFRLHSAENDAGWCFCAAWWTPTWEGWGDRTAEQNRSTREELCRTGEYDGYLLYDEGNPVAWCQVGPRDRLTKLVRQFHFDPSPETWAVSCLLVAPAFRRRGLAAHLLRQVIRDLKARGVRRVECYPKRGEGLSDGELWNGPEAMYRDAGFTLFRDDPKRPVLALDLEPDR
jgi:ribosomal protein S18 acetylase RimI-like enzyme